MMFISTLLACGAAQDSRNVSLNIELVLNACSAFYNNDGSEKMVKVGKAGLLVVYIF